MKILFMIIFLFISLLEAKSLEKVSLQFHWLDQFEFAGYYMAKEKGYYKQAGFDVEFKNYVFGMNVQDEVLNNKSTFAIGGSDLIISLSKNQNFKLLASIFQSSPLVLLATSKSKINSIKDFKGKRVMITPDAVSSVTFNAMMKKENLMMKDLIPLKHSFDVQDLIDGKTDLFQSYISNEPYSLIKHEIKPIIFDPKNYGFDFYSDILFTSTKYYEQNPHNVIKFKKATLRGWQYAFDNIEETIDIMLKKYNTQKKNKGALLYEAKKLKELAYVKNIPLGNINKIKLQRIFDAYNIMNLTKNIIDFDKVFVSEKTDKNKLTIKEQEFIQKHPIVKIAGTTDSAPLLIKNNDGEFEGIDVDIANLIYQSTGLKIVYEDNLWDTSVNKAINKEVDGISGSVYNMEREKYFSISKVYMKSTPKVYVKKGNPLNIKDIKDIENKTIVIRKGTLAIEKLAKQLKNKIIYKDTSIEMVKSIISGEADFFIFFDNIEYIVNKEGIDYINVAFTLGNARDIVFSLRNDWPELVSIINKGLDSIPEYEKVEIRKKWFGSYAKKDKLAFTNEEKIYLEQKGTIKTCIDKNWMPLGKIDSKGNHIGISADILQEMRKNSGIKFELVPTENWNETLLFAKNKKCDMFLLAMETSNRKKFMNFTLPYVSFPLVITTKDSSQIFIDNMELLSNKKVAFVKDYAYVEILKQKYPSINIIEVKNITEGLELVQKGKVFGYIDTLPSTAYVIQKEGFIDLKIAGKFDEKHELSIATRDDEPILNAIMQNIQNSIEDETKQKILNKWLTIKFEERVDYTLLYEVLSVVFLFILFGLWRYYEIQKSKQFMEEKNQELQNAYAQYYWLTENMDDVVWTMSIDGSFSYISPSVEKLRGFSVDEIKKQTFEEVICEGSRQIVIDEMTVGIEAASKGEIPPSRNLRVEQPCKDGTTVWTEVNSRLVVDEKTNEMKFIGLTRDITKTIEYEKGIKLAKDKAEKAAQVKSDFLANMSHEIRTPLNGIIGLTDLVLNTTLNELQKDYLLKTQSSFSNLLNIINDILDYSKMEAGKLTILNNPFYFNDLLNNIDSLFSYKIEEKKLKLNYNIDDNIPEILIGDTLRLQQVFNNLIGNAIKFTHYGKIVIDIRLTKETSKKVFLQVCIEDSGIGISTQDQEKLFNIFEQVDNSSTRKYAGTGLGLTITKQIVELMDGDIWIESQKDIGSKFYFNLSFEYVREKKKDKSIGYKEDKSKKQLLKAKGNVLLVEDNSINQIVFKNNLIKYGLDIDVASNGMEAIKKQQNKNYDIIFMDIQMPIMDGIEATKRIREYNIETPIVALTAAAMQKDKNKTTNAGMNHHLSKPIVWNEIEEIIKEYLSFEYTSKDIEPEAYEHIPIVDGIDIKKIMNYTGLPLEKIYILLNKFQYQYCNFEDKINSFKLSSEEFGEYIHKLKGTSGNLQMMEVSDLVSKVESSSDKEMIDSLLLELNTKIQIIVLSIQKTIVPLINDTQKKLSLTQTLDSIENLLYDIGDFNFIESSRIQLVINSLDLIENSKKVDLLKSFEENDYEQLTILLNSIKEDLNRLEG